MNTALCAKVPGDDGFRQPQPCVGRAHTSLDKLPNSSIYSAILSDFSPCGSVYAVTMSSLIDISHCVQIVSLMLSTVSDSYTFQSHHGPAGRGSWDFLSSMMAGAKPIVCTYILHTQGSSQKSPPRSTPSSTLQLLSAQEMQQGRPRAARTNSPHTRKQTRSAQQSRGAVETPCWCFSLC